MKAKRRGGFAPPVTPSDEYEYELATIEFGGLTEYGYPAGTTLVVRTDVKVPLERIALVELADGRQAFGPLVRDKAGDLRIDSLSCGMYGHSIKRVLGLVLGPLASGAEATRVPGPVTGERSTVDPEGSYTVEVNATEGGGVLGRVTIEPGPVVKGDIAAARDASGQMRFGRVTYAGKRAITICILASAERMRVAVGDVLGRVVNVEKIQSDTKPSVDDATSGQIEALRARLEKLDGPDNEAERFRLRRAIYDLEQQTVDPDDDEWPEYIGGES